MKIAIPTHNRSHRFHALDWCNKAFGEENVFVFFHNEEQKETYLKAGLKIKNPVVTNAPRGIQNQQNAILDYFKEDEEIVVLHDDIKYFSRLLDGKLLRIDDQFIKKEFERNFAEARKLKMKLWGTYPVRNHFFMKKKESYDQFIISTCMGIINNSLRFDPVLTIKEDYDYTIQNIIKYGGAIRYDWLYAEAAHLEKKGGGNDFIWSDEENILKIQEYILKKWPSYLRANPKRKGEVLMIRKKSVAKNKG